MIGASAGIDPPSGPSEVHEDGGQIPALRAERSLKLGH